MKISNRLIAVVYIAAFLWMIFVIIILSSCNTVHKTLSKSTEQVDSVKTSRSESTLVKKSDSNGTKTEAGDYERERIYLYDTVYLPGKDGKVQIKYVPRLYKETEKGNYNKEETAQINNYDSLSKRATDSTAVGKVIKQINKDKESKRFPMLYLLIGAAVAFAYFLFRKRYLINV